MRLLRFDELKSRKGIPFSRMHIGRLEKAGAFPRRIRLAARTIAWLEDEVDAHLAAKIAARHPVETEHGPVAPDAFQRGTKA